MGGKGQQPGADVLPEWTKLGKLVFTCPRGAKWPKLSDPPPSATSPLPHPRQFPKGRKLFSAFSKRGI